MRYPNIVFDIGGVLLEFSSQWLMDTFLGDTAPEDRRLIDQWLFGSGLWHKRDRGDFDDDELFVWSRAQLPRRVHAAFERMINESWPAMPQLRTGEIIPRLKARGHKLFLLTNTPAAFHRNYAKIPHFEMFDGFYASCDVGVMKPDAEFYQGFLRKFDLRGEECFFIDDLPQNCAGAEAVGIRTFCYDTRDFAGLKLALGLEECV